jgi:vesicle coat complex subunit
LKKLQILSMLASDLTINSILKELSTTAKAQDEAVALASVITIAECAKRSAHLAHLCTRHLISFLKCHRATVVAQAIVVLRELITQDPERHHKVIVHCARILDTLEFPEAKASAIWVVGKYHRLMPTMAAETLRKLVVSFPREVQTVKQQVSS